MSIVLQAVLCSARKMVRPKQLLKLLVPGMYILILYRNRLF